MGHIRKHASHGMARLAGADRAVPPSPKEGTQWVDVARGFATIWIVLVHFVERWAVGAYFGNPSAQWPPLADRLAQIHPLPIGGLDGWTANVLRYAGWLGDQGVHFIVASGIGLTLSALRAGSRFSTGEFYRSRLLRLMPLWIAAHLVFMAVGLLIGGLSPLDWRSWASLVGLRFLPEVFHFFAPAWWFIGLLLQFYFVFPLLMRWLRAMGPTRFFLVVGSLSLLIRGWGLLYLDDLVDWWSRGGFFVTRLPEFVFGMAFAAVLWDRRERPVTGPLPGLAIAAAAVVLLGNALSFTLVGMTFAFLLTGAGWMLLFYGLAAGTERGIGRMLGWVSAHSYSLFLVHHPFIARLVPPDLEDRSWLMMIGMLAAILALSVVAAIALERGTEFVQRWLSRARTARERVRIAASSFVAASLFAAALLTAEGLVRRFDPQEVLGWGERPSLQPDPRYGYKLVPGQTTRLRWLSYDYVVQANELGFPGPDYPAERAPGMLRILVTGDAYESAEGVDTNQSWPRLLEQLLRDRGVPAEVLNFSITGWGPNQYRAVIQDFVPVYRPDLVIVGFFVNEFGDVLTRDERYGNAPGFDAPPQESLRYFLTLTHLRAWIKNSLRSGPLGALRPDTESPGYFFGYYVALERDQLNAMEDAAGLVEERLREIKQTTEQHDGRLLLVQVPAPAQICPPESVEYTPPGIDIGDDARFDLDQPQRITRRICSDLAIECLDLRPAFEGSASLRPCQPKNLHWTRAGHELVANFVSRRLLAGPVSQSPDSVDTGQREQNR